MTSKVIEERAVNRTEAGRRLAALRRRAGLTQTQLGTAAALPQSTVGNIETGSRGMTPEQRVSLARALGVDPAVLDPASTPDLDSAAMPSVSPPPPLPTRSVSDRDRSVASSPMPASLEAYLAKHVRLHPAVRHHLQINHDLRTEGWVERDEAFWADLAVYFAKRLRVPLEEEGGAQGSGAPRKGKG